MAITLIFLNDFFIVVYGFHNVVQGFIGGYVSYAATLAPK
jgi:hypothetical protein